MCSSDLPTVSATATNATCSASDGTATATVLGGTSPYTYQWDAFAGNQITSVATSLAIGSYDVTVTDASGCTASATATVGSSGSRSEERRAGKEGRARWAP